MNPQKVIGFHQNPRRFPLATSPVCLPALHEFPSPAIRCGIHEESKVRFQGELGTSIQLQIRIERLAGMLLQLVLAELERKDFLAPDLLCRERAEQDRSPSRGPMIEVNVNCLACIHAQLRFDARLRTDSPMS